MTPARHETLPIRTSADVVAVRQKVRAWAAELRFSLVDQTKIVTAASELARNTLEHGKGGEAHLEVVDRAPRRGLRLTFEDRGPGIPDVELALKDGYTTGGGQVLLGPAASGDALEIVALDRGPGITDLRRALEDGFSTAGTAGQGLGAIVRIASAFDVYSAPGKGTALFARVGRAAAAPVEVGAVNVPVATERESGDAWAVEWPAGRPVVLVADGLGRLHDPTRFPVLVLEDNPETVFIYDKYLKGTPFQVIPTATTAEARRLIREVRPVAAVVDIMLGSESSWSLISEIKSSASTKGMPVFVVTMVDNRHKATALGADDFAEKPLERAWLVERLERAVERLPRERVLVVDDDAASRYLVAGVLAETRYAVVEASGGAEALEAVARAQPAAVILDLSMPDVAGEEVLARLRDGPSTRELPVIVHTALPIDAALRARLVGASAFVPKSAPRATVLATFRETLARAAARSPVEVGAE